MKRTRFIGGVILLLVATLAFVFVDTEASLPIAITLMVVGIALVATSRRGV